MIERVVWRPGAEHPAPHACRIPAQPTLQALLDIVGQSATRLGMPVQALRADRVLSPTHLAMAHVHARRARAAGRARASDPAIETLLFAACSRQIQDALATLGRPDDGSVPLVLVALPDRSDALDLVAAARAVGADASPWQPDPEAIVWWSGRLGLAPTAGLSAVEDALLAAMAALAVAKQ